MTKWLVEQFRKRASNGSFWKEVPASIFRFKVNKRERGWKIFFPTLSLKWCRDQKYLHDRTSKNMVVYFWIFSLSNIWKVDIIWIIKMPPEMIQPSKNDLDHTKFIERAFFSDEQSVTDQSWLGYNILDIGLEKALTQWKWW